MKVSNTVIVAVFSAFLMGFLSGVTGMFFGMSVDSETEKPILREYKFFNSFISGEFDVNSESPDIQNSVERLMRGYTTTLEAIATELANDEERLIAMSALAQMMVFANIKMSEIVEVIRSKRLSPKNSEDRKKDPAEHKKFI